MPEPTTSAVAESFPILDALGCVHATFLTRQPGINVRTDRDSALSALRASHDRILNALGFPPRAHAEQVHGNAVAVVREPAFLPTPGVDGLATDRTGVTLVIYVADCAAVYLVDPKKKAIALFHSGRKGTEANILASAVNCMASNFGSRAEDLVGVVSPCIRPPNYEVDFAATIAAQARACGIGKFVDAGTCTASHPDRYYSYRREKGSTGRMLAALALRE